MFSRSNISDNSTSGLSAGRSNDNHARDVDDNNSVQSMLAMMMGKHKSSSSQSPLSLQGESDDEDDIENCDQGVAESIESYDCIALSSLSSLKEKSNSVNSYIKNYDCIALSSLTLLKEKSNSVSSTQGIDVSDIASLSSLSQLTWNSRKKKKAFDKDEDKKSTRTNRTSITESTASASSSSSKSLSHSGSTTSLHSQGGSRRFKCILTLAFFLAFILFVIIAVLGYILYAIKSDDDKALSLFTVDFWKVSVKNSLNFWEKEGEPGEDYLSMIDGEE